MKLTIVNGFFLPVPPAAGGSTEKSWFRLGREFAARGHQVTSLSRHWPGWPREEMIDGVLHRRLPGCDHQRSLRRNLLADFIWSWRVLRALPPAEIVICHSVFLPVWLPRIKPRAGRVVVMAGRIPKGQYRRYRRISRVLAPSRFVADRVGAENPRLASVTRVTGYPIDWTLLASQPSMPSSAVPAARPDEVTLGFVGRLHPEKGLMLLAGALERLAGVSGLPPWRLVLCGPSEVARGGGGPDLVAELRRRLSSVVSEDRLHLVGPRFDDRSLAAVYQRLDVFCYPSVAEEGETFGVAVAEAMAAGSLPIVSGLACFRELVQDGRNGLVFDHAGPDPAAALAGAIEQALRDGAARRNMSAVARADARRYDFPEFAGALLDDFANLTVR